MAKLQQKRDLELMLLDHEETCEIIHRRYLSEAARPEETWRSQYLRKHRRSSNGAATASVRRPVSTSQLPRTTADQLVSILELSKDTRSNCSSASVRCC